MFGFLTFGTTLTFLDQAAKNQIEERDGAEFPKKMPGLEKAVMLYKNHNPGFSFGFLKGSSAVKTVPLCLTSALAGVWVYLMGTRGRFVEKLAFTLTLAGGISNLYDRLRRGYVVDYFSIQWKALKKVVLNLGDLFILAGAILMTVHGFFQALKEE